MTTNFCKGLRPGLYAITDSRLTPPDQLLAMVEAALRGGAVLIQYREKLAPAAERLRQARDLNAACINAGVPLIINDDPQLARRVGAAGVHLGQGDVALSEARHLLGDEAIIGITCHDSLALASAAATGGADYLAFGRFFASATKPGAPLANQQVLAEARQFGRPITAIGGITLDNGAELVRGGADLLAVVGGLFGCPPIEAQARRFSKLLALHHPRFQAN